MSTANVNAIVVEPSHSGAAALRRFAWKEYRMFRGLWLAVFIAGGLLQWALHLLMSPSIDHAAMLFSTALAAAVLYAVGAAATTFSVEHEEDTYGYLLALPTTWWPLYAGKLLVATLSAVLLATALAFVGWMLCGFRAPGGHNATVALGMLGMGIIEGLAWGTLFSLIVKRPLIAALLTLVVGTVAVNFAVNATSNFAVGSIVPQAYLDAIPLRLAIVAAVSVGSVAVARRWLEVGTRPRRLAHFAASSQQNAPVPLRHSRRGLLARLLWQSCRESWKLLLLPIGVASVLLLSIAALVGLNASAAQLTTVVITATVLSLPALYGALAFSADQRRGGYRFLAEHAARPRYVWLARHIVWLGTLVILFVAIPLTLASLAAAGLSRTAAASLSHHTNWGPQPYVSATGLVYHQLWAATLVMRGASLAVFGTLAAYAVGQLCSMVMRSEILAAFLAVVLSVVLGAWLAVLFAWQLSGWLFLLPLAAGLMLATWLRAPAWIEGRNAWRTWMNPVLAIVAPVILIGILLPSARLSQLPKVVRDVAYQGQPVAVEAAIKLEVDGYLHGDTPEARKTAETYMMAAERLVIGPKENLLAPWETSEFLEDGEFGLLGGIDVTKIPNDQLDAYFTAKEQQLELIRQSHAAAVDAAITASERPTCRFDFDLHLVAPDPRGQGEQTGLRSLPLYQTLSELQRAVAPPSVEPDETFTRLLAALRMSAHLRSGQPAVVFMDQLHVEQLLLQRIGQWTLQNGRTSDELRDALEKLTTHFRTAPELHESLIADHLLVRDALEGKETPLALALMPEASHVYLAYLANQLPWERERALRALDHITLHVLRDAQQLTELTRSTSHDLRSDYLRHWLRPRHWEKLSATWQIAEPAAATSYLTLLEYTARVPIHEQYRSYCDNEVCRRGAILQLALAMHRLDHGDYPAQLADLVPDYLDRLPLDPYSQQPFQYEPNGLDLPLQDDSYYAHFLRLEPHTPFLWSTGPGNARLLRRRNTWYEGDVNAPSDERSAVHETVYVLRRQEPPWSNESAFVFSLAE